MRFALQIALGAASAALFAPGCSGSTVGASQLDGSLGAGGEGGEGAAITDVATGDELTCRANSDCPVVSPDNYSLVCIGPYEASACVHPINDSSIGQPCNDDSQCPYSPYSEICRTATPGHESLGADASDGGFVCSGYFSCTEDSQCGPGHVCRHPSVPYGWVGPTTGLACANPCAADIDCPPTTTCDLSGHCRDRTCDECPSYFLCNAGACVIPSCSTDADCPGGFCVVGSCAGSLGRCVLFCN